MYWLFSPDVLAGASRASTGVNSESPGATRRQLVPRRDASLPADGKDALRHGDKNRRVSLSGEKPDPETKNRQSAPRPAATRWTGTRSRREPALTDRSGAGGGKTARAPRKKL
jgi:hypothetical protein